MGIEDAKRQKLIYHLTSVENFEAIVKYGLLPRNELKNKKYIFSDVADINIINKRALLNLGDYIPFHFHPYSAFDVAVKNKYEAKKMMYMCMDRDVARKHRFKILPKHPLSSSNIQLYSYDEGFEKIEWDILQTKDRQDDYAKEVKMAECLYRGKIPITAFCMIFVASDEIKKLIENIMEEHGIPYRRRPIVKVQEKWFEGYDKKGG